MVLVVQSGNSQSVFGSACKHSSMPITFFLNFALGAIAGSVANAVIYRLPRGLSWFADRSICHHCKHELAWYDLLPLLSYIYLRGKCRYCHKSIGYFWLELTCGLVFAYFGFSVLSLLFLVSLIIAIMDLETMLVSDWLVIIWGILVLLSGNFSLVGAFLGFGAIGALWLVTKGRGMGSGDIGIAAVLGLWLGWPKILIALWLAFTIGALFGVIGIVRKTVNLKSQIPFGPFLILGGWLAYFFGDMISQWILIF